MNVPIPCDKVHEQRTGGEICPYCEIARLREALKKMVDTHGMHGPCKNHSCSNCDRAYKTAKQALKGGE